MSPEVAEHHPVSEHSVTITTWRAAVKDDSGKKFAELVHEDVVLEGSVFAAPIEGRDAVSACDRS